MDQRIDPAMAAFRAAIDARAASQPPIRLDAPLTEMRALTERLNLPDAEGGPAMADSSDRWLPVRGRRLLCRVHRPTQTTALLPVLVYMHGGGWVINSIDTHDRLMREYAAASGCVVIALDYALSPEAPFPQALEECVAVLDFVATQGASWGLDSARVVVGGDSAGANLAIGAALMLRDTAEGPELRGLLLNYGVFDSRLDTPSYGAFATGYGLTRERMTFFWNAYAQRAVDRTHPYAAPLRADLKGLAPVLLQVAELDVLASENHAMAERLANAGVAVESETFPGMLHGFLRAAGKVPSADAAIKRAGAWLRAHMA